MRTAQNHALLKALAAELKARRAGLEISQEELADKAELNRTFIGKIETAANQPSLTAFVRIAEGLAVDPVDLLQEVMGRYKKELRAAKKPS